MDQRQRELAVRPDASYLGAGSGGFRQDQPPHAALSTALLARVNEPEEILAITFTRKARRRCARILGELRDAESGAEPASSHARQTRALALAALARDRERDWQVLDSPHRLRVQTIDAFEASLVGRLPALSQLGISPSATDRPAALYGAAVRDALRTMATDAREALVELLCLFDNNLETASRSLLTLLEKRDQWLPAMGPNPLGEAGPEALRAALEENLRRLIAPELERLDALVPVDLSAELGAMARTAASRMESGEGVTGILAALTGWPATDDAGLPAWRTLGDWLLTKEGGLRKSVTKREGFPPDDKAAKQRMLDLLTALAAHEDFVAAMGRVKALPDAFYSDSQWRVLEALFRFLRAVVPSLHMQFVLHRETDFSEIALRATTALESAPGIPTLLAERLDAQIQHLLVDEFQDTSALQMLLVRKLTENWTPGDGRTLFLVGDPCLIDLRLAQRARRVVPSRPRRLVPGLPPLGVLQLQRNSAPGAP